MGEVGFFEELKAMYSVVLLTNFILNSSQPAFSIWEQAIE